MIFACVLWIIDYFANENLLTAKNFSCYYDVISGGYGILHKKINFFWKKVLTYWDECHINHLADWERRLKEASRGNSGYRK